MPELKIYDKAKYHYDGEFPEDLDQSQAFVHTGMFLGWIVNTKLYSEEFGDDNADEMARFQRREITGPQLYALCDGVLTSDDLNEEGYAFAEYYFDFDNGAYLADYEQLLASSLPTTYHVPDTWPNYDLLKQHIDSIYKTWKRERRSSGN